MNNKIIAELLGLVVIFAIIWIFFVYVNPFPDKINMDVSPEKEQMVGEFLIKNILSTNTEIESDEIDSAIYIIKQRLMSGLGLTNYDYKIIIIKQNDINAYALPGGYIVIFSKLLKFSKSPEELAAVIAHEMGHIEHQDVVKRLIKEFGIKVIFSVLNGSDNMLISEIAEIAASTAFDRNQEKNADEFAMKLLVSSKINPKAISSFFRRLSTKYGSQRDELKFLSSHPMVNKRIKASLEYEVPENFKTNPFNLDWDAVKKSLN